jgi:hypothetical protein
LEDLAAHPEIAADFNALVEPDAHAIPDSELRATGGCESVRAVVDLGRRHWSTASCVLRARPTVRGVLVDSPAASLLATLRHVT